MIELQEGQIARIKLNNEKQYLVKVLDTNWSFTQVEFTNGKTAVIYNSEIKEVL